ncbi:hypothetical protein LAZ67_21002074 [Cordylochernes scorpioides]|uniref:Tc1-like transposase DDE domain-containing protein n=1 Tax=Cordylochernes scorpioides TaxID=51811 RepID=A0ABY6LMP7_9ARAC|nr:hypothetical protein LAZ67_21002074 [Cordylochernes scorpioides]
MSCYSLKRLIKSFEETGSLEAKPRSGRPSTCQSVAVTVLQNSEAIETLSTYGEMQLVALLFLGLATGSLAVGLGITRDASVTVNLDNQKAPLWGPVGLGGYGGIGLGGVGLGGIGLGGNGGIGLKGVGIGAPLVGGVVSGPIGGIGRAALVLVASDELVLERASVLVAWVWRQRLEWCQARSTWMTEWHRVVFSDESRFCLSSDSRRVRMWRRRGERSNPVAIGTMTAQRYVDDVLRPVTLPYLQGVPNALYQQDNARPHTARISQQALQDVQMLPWPPYSPDLSPIEHGWDIIGRRFHALPQRRSEDELWQMMQLAVLLLLGLATGSLAVGLGLGVTRDASVTVNLDNQKAPLWGPVGLGGYGGIGLGGIGLSGIGGIGLKGVGISAPLVGGVVSGPIGGIGLGGVGLGGIGGIGLGGIGGIGLKGIGIGRVASAPLVGGVVSGPIGGIGLGGVGLGLGGVGLGKGIGLGGLGLVGPIGLGLGGIH